MSAMSSEELGQVLIKKLGDAKSLNSLDLSQSLKINHNTIVGCINSLKSLEIIDSEPVQYNSWELTSEGAQIAQSGSYEAQVFDMVKQLGQVSLVDLKAKVPNSNVGVGKAVSNGWIKIEKPSNLIHPVVQSIEDEVKINLNHILSSNFDKVSQDKKQDYKKRKLVKDISIVTYNITKGKNFGTPVTKGETELTAEMISSGSWKNVVFKPYNLEAQGVAPSRGHLHPLLKVRAEFRQIFLEMGFEEMPTNQYVESSFWNFDALYQPQQHPARDAHDTFFITHPKECKDPPQDYMERVSKTHSSGGYGSIGYGYKWSIDEAKKNLLRTHTTAVSARMLYKLAQQPKFTPVKYFSIDRVFRNETLDATHLAEFHQIEGVVADVNITLGDLIGVINQFFKKLGINDVIFKPAYNPYTEPSMEIFCFHPGLGKMIEVGNSGMFRPELLLPMGLPPNVNVIAWGLSLERPTMIKYGINNIRDLVGPRVQLQMVYNNPICRLDKQ